MPLFPRPVELINKTVSQAGLQIIRNIPYGPGLRARLDIYIPVRAGENLPVIVFFYGGSWKWGERADYAFVACILAAKGFIVAVPDYRLYPEVRFPDFLADCAAATTYVGRNIAAHGGNPAEIFLFGHSAGAYNAAMLALAPDFLAQAGFAGPPLAGIIGLSGPYDFLPLRDPDIKDIFSPPADIKTTQPITYAGQAAPPLFLAHGSADITVLPRNTTALAARLRAAGNSVETRLYPKLGHIGIILSLLPYLAWRAPVLADILAFIAATRKSGLDSDGANLQAEVLL